MTDPAPLSHALDEAVAAVADAIEVHYRCQSPDPAAVLEVREALSRAMRWVAEASRLEFQGRQAAPQPDPESPRVSPGRAA